MAVDSNILLLHYIPLTGFSYCFIADKDTCKCKKITLHTRICTLLNRGQAFGHRPSSEKALKNGNSVYAGHRIVLSLCLPEEGL